MWAVAGLSYEERGRGTGLWTAALFLGEFICPLLILGLAGVLGGLGGGLAVVGVISLVCAAGARPVLARRTLLNA